jgi:hypothetical protein
VRAIREKEVCGTTNCAVHYDAVSDSSLVMYI